VFFFFSRENPQKTIFKNLKKFLKISDYNSKGLPKQSTNRSRHGFLVAINIQRFILDDNFRVMLMGGHIGHSFLNGLIKSDVANVWCRTAQMMLASSQSGCGHSPGHHWATIRVIVVSVIGWVVEELLGCSGGHLWTIAIWPPIWISRIGWGRHH
jgi:hypothetical protein